jgi:hypothetical protein
MLLKAKLSFSSPVLPFMLDDPGMIAGELWTNQESSSSIRFHHGSSCSHIT